MEHPDHPARFGRAVTGFLLACLAVGLCVASPVAVLGFAKSPSVAAIAAGLMIAGMIAMFTAFLTFVPAAALIWLSWQRGWTTLWTHMLIAAALGIAAVVATSLINEPGFGLPLILSGPVAGFVYWWVAVRPGPNAGTSPQSGHEEA